MNAMHALLSSRAFEAVVFAAAVVFTVVSLEMFRARLERSINFEHARAAGILLALVFLCMVIGGIADFAMVGLPTLLNLGFFLSGAAGAGILASLMLEHGSDREMRRVAASDL
jgi:hypothetical protein